MAAPLTPSNFNVQTGQGNVLTSWDIADTATSYSIERSLDGVTYTLLHTNSGTPLYNYYLDETATAGTMYYYRVFASNSDGDSDPTTAQSVVPAPIGQVSLQWVRMMAQLRADMINSQFVSLPEWNSYISNSYKDLYNLLIQKFGDDYFNSSTYTLTTDGASTLYPLPADFYKSSLVEVSLNPSDPNARVTLRRYMRVQQNLWNYPNVYTFYGITNLRYRFTGNYIQLVPIAQAGNTVRIWYSPRPEALIQDTQLLDGIAGYEDIVVLSAARKALVKQEQETMQIDQELATMHQRIEEAAENRDIGDPETVSDSKMRNFSWSESDGYGSGSFGSGW